MGKQSQNRPAKGEVRFHGATFKLQTKETAVRDDGVTKKQSPTRKDK